MIIDELRRAIDELTSQNKEILKELEIIADQDAHVRTILNRKIKVEQIKQSTEDKLKKFNIHNRTYSTGIIANLKKQLFLKNFEVFRSNFENLSFFASNNFFLKFAIAWTHRPMTIQEFILHIKIKSLNQRWWKIGWACIFFHFLGNDVQYF